MKMIERAFAAALLLAIAWPAGALAVSNDSTLSGETLEWPLPWRDGVELRYWTEGYDDLGDPRERQRTGVTAIETLRITENGDKGYLQHWTIADSRFETVEGGAGGAAVMQAMRDAMGDIELEVELDRHGTDSGVRNLDEISARMGPAMHAALLAALEEEINASGAAFDADHLKIQRLAALNYIDAVVEWGASPEAVQALVGDDVAQFNRFVGTTMVEGLEYETGETFIHPGTGAALPATMRFSGRVADPDSDEVLLEWTTRLDPDQALAGSDGDDTPGTATDGLSMSEEGWLRYRRSSGVIEMLEATLTHRLQGTLTVKRRRMRLLDGDQDHAWPVDTPPVPAAI
ncbi:hypothetical protein WCE55_04025 [Luteimonas sp. MJ293]|uniref:hypothetical protein n=1 Tax=Luteimonas sp. MJ146 TaxID=3129240 RepID=UPI0031BAE265